MSRRGVALCLFLLLLPVLICILTLTYWHAWAKSHVLDAQLAKAVRTNHVRLVKVLLRLGANPFAPNQEGWSLRRNGRDPHAVGLYSDHGGLGENTVQTLMDFARDNPSLP